MADGLTVVVGLGKSGASTVRFLINQGRAVAVTDSRPSPPGLAEVRAVHPNVVIKSGGFDQQLLLNAQQIILSPGVSLQTPEVVASINQGISVIGDVELFLQYAKAPVIAITGTNGKSTVTTLVGEILRAAGKQVKVGGNLGTPVLDFLQSTPPEYYVLELSSFQLETVSSLAAYCAVNLNLSSDHLDRYPDFASYQQAKLHVYKNAERAVINLDDDASHQGINNEHVTTFSLNQPADFCILRQNSIDYLAYKKQPIIAASELKLIGKHQWANALAAMAIAYQCGASFDDMRQVLSTFEGLSHRCQLVAKTNNVVWYNDSKATNVGATVASISGVAALTRGKIVLIAGGEAKETDFSLLAQVAEKHVGEAILYGRDKELLYNALRNKVAVVMVNDLKEAVTRAQRAANPGDAILLAPACTSFDMFKNFEDRGEVFTRLAQEQM